MLPFGIDPVEFDVNTSQAPDELVETIAAQSDEQSGAHDTRELERIRDRNLVGILRALEANDWNRQSPTALTCKTRYAISSALRPKFRASKMRLRGSHP